MRSESNNRLYVRNLAQKILWDEELAGQISDGMWENARPHDHWQPWCDATVVVAPSHLGRTFYARKDSYNLASSDLLDIVGGRMLAKVQETIPDYTMKSMLADLRDLRKTMKLHVERLSDEEQATAVLNGASEPFADQPVAKDPYEGHRNGNGVQVDDPAAGPGPSKLLRKPTKTVSAYVTWLKTQLGAEAWDDLSQDPVRLAEVSLQNYGAYQAIRRDAKNAK